MTVLTSVPTPPSDHRKIDPLLETIILRCLARRPADRFANAKELGLALRDLRAAHEWTTADIQTHTKVLPGAPVAAPYDFADHTVVMEGSAPAPRAPQPTRPPGDTPRSAPLTPPRQSYVSSAAFSSYAPPPPPSMPAPRRRSPFGIAALVVLVLLALVPIAYLVAIHATSRPAVGMLRLH